MDQTNASRPLRLLLSVCLDAGSRGISEHAGLSSAAGISESVLAPLVSGLGGWCNLHQSDHESPRITEGTLQTVDSGRPAGHEEEEEENVEAHKRRKRSLTEAMKGSIKFTQFTIKSIFSCFLLPLKGSRVHILIYLR